MESKLSLHIKNDLSELKKVAQSFSNFNKKHRLPLKVFNTVDLALDEILNNIISYGYDDNNAHVIDIHISVVDKGIIVEIKDDGRPFNPLSVVDADTKKTMDERPIGGLGLHLIRNMMDDVQYIYKDNKNCLTMKKQIMEI